MNGKLRKALITMGMSENASESEAERFMTENNIRATEAQDSPEAVAKRMLELMTTAARYNCVDDVSKMAREGKSDAEILGWILENRMHAEPVATREIGLSNKEKKEYSLRRAILAKRENNWGLAPFELEVSKATEKIMHQNARGFMIPFDILSHRTAAGGQVVGTAGDGGNLVATDLLAGSFIDEIEKVGVLAQLGVTRLNGLVGDIAIPKQTAGCTYYFIGEQDDATLSKATFSQVSLTPKTAAGKMIFSRQLLLQSSISVENFVRKAIASALRDAMEYGVFLGTGANGQPTGLLNRMDTNSIALGTNGAVLTWRDIIKFETELGVDNVLDDGTMAYVTNAKVRGDLKGTEKASNTGKFVWEQAAGMRGVGDVNGYPAYSSGFFPSNLTKGTTTTACSAMAFGKFSDIIVASWGALDFIVDPYSESDSGDTKVVAFNSFDTNVRHGESFCVCKDIKVN